MFFQFNLWVHITSNFQNSIQYLSSYCKFTYGYMIPSSGFEIIMLGYRDNSACTVSSALERQPRLNIYIYRHIMIHGHIIQLNNFIIISYLPENIIFLMSVKLFLNLCRVFFYSFITQLWIWWKQIISNLFLFDFSIFFLFFYRFEKT